VNNKGFLVVHLVAVLHNQLESCGFTSLWGHWDFSLI